MRVWPPSTANCPIRKADLTERLQIHLLPDILRNKIAAGEVVQRPASVVKELVENALDAGAGAIDITIENGGRDLIQIVDDGHGIPSEELALAVERHATSKIAEVDDLFKIRTMGFRGEALPSIGSVSMLEIVSRAEGAEEAFRYEVQAGKGTELEPFAWERGTRVTVRNLFFNVPARLKFLKAKRTELNHILDRVKPLALVNPQIAFKLTADSRVVLDLRPGSQQDRIGAVFNSSYVPKLIEVDEQRGAIKVNGHVGNLDLVRVARGEQYLFVNQRPISDRLLSNAVFQVFKSVIQRGEYPFYVLALEVPTEDVDVNVHPTKTEVKFKDEWRVYQVVKDAVERAVRDKLAMLPGYQDRAFNSFAPPVLPISNQTSFGMPASSGSGGHDGIPAPVRNAEEAELLEKARQFSQVLDRGPVQQRPQRMSEGFIWQVHNKYILSQINSGIAIIDQHVAHERILFEEALRDMDKNRGVSQTLLFPQTQEFSADDFEILMEMLPMLNQLGFQLREFGPRTVIIEAVPVDMRAGSEGQIIKEMIDHFRENRVFDYSPAKRLAASYSCKAAIKAGDPLNEEEMRTLVDRLFTTENPFYCPHGRPIILNLSIDELDKRFERH